MAVVVQIVGPPLDALVWVARFGQRHPHPLASLIGGQKHRSHVQ